MIYHFIDTHCHFDFPPFIDDAAAALQLAGQSGVVKIIVPAVSEEKFDTLIALSETYSPLYAALGLHPIYIAQHTGSALQKLKACLDVHHAKVVAIGEVGLDFYLTEPQYERQQQLLEQQIALAHEYDLPLILHSRKSHDQLAMVLKKANLPRTGVVHGFSGSYQQAMHFIEAGYFIGVGGVITYPRAAKTRNTIAALPLERLLLETDAPDMPLSGFQGQANRPERIVQVFETLCQLRSESPQQIARQIYANSRALFRLE